MEGCSSEPIEPLLDPPLLMSHKKDAGLKWVQKAHSYWVKNNDVAKTLKKATHIKGRLLDQAVIQFNCVPFHDENFS